jgi:hypothetical protein
MRQRSSTQARKHVASTAGNESNTPQCQRAVTREFFVAETFVAEFFCGDFALLGLKRLEIAQNGMKNSHDALRWSSKKLLAAWDCFDSINCFDALLGSLILH